MRRIPSPKKRGPHFFHGGQISGDLQANACAVPYSVPLFFSIMMHYDFDASRRKKNDFDKEEQREEKYDYRRGLLGKARSFPNASRM